MTTSKDWFDARSPMPSWRSSLQADLRLGKLIKDTERRGITLRQIEKLVGWAMTTRKNWLDARSPMPSWRRSLVISVGYSMFVMHLDQLDDTQIVIPVSSQNVSRRSIW